MGGGSFHYYETVETISDISEMLEKVKMHSKAVSVLSRVLFSGKSEGVHGPP